MNMFFKSKQISTAGNYNKVKNKVKGCFNKKKLRLIRKSMRKLNKSQIRDLGGRDRVKKTGILTFQTYL